MKTKRHIAPLILPLAFAAMASLFTSCSDTEKSGTKTGEPFASIDPIDSSSWAVNPAAHGMTAEEFIQAESLHFMKGMAKREGINNFFHFTSLAKAEDKWVVSPNNDVIYSMAIVDASNGFTLTLPDTGDRFITGQTVSEEHMSHQLVGGGVYEFTGEEFNGSHVAIGVRVGTDASAADVAHIVEELQPQMTVESNSAGEVPEYNEDALLKVRSALMAEYNKLPDTFGQMTDDVKKVKDWEKFTYTTAGAWGLAEDKYAMYLPYNLKGAKKDICYTATYAQPKVGEFWSITAYNNEKYLMSNENNIVNTGNAVLNDDGTFTVHFGPESFRDRKDVKNFILTTEDDWGFLMRAYEPDVEAFRAYKVPEIKPVDATEATAGNGVSSKPVTEENYVVAESDWYFTGVQKKAGVNTWMHDDPVSKDNQQVIRSNRDVVYSIAIVDVSKGASFTVPPSDEFQLIHIIDEAHLFHQVLLNGESLNVTADDIEGEYVYLLARTKDNGDFKDTKARQVVLEFKANASRPYKSKGFDEKEVVAFREKLVGRINAGEEIVEEHNAFGKTLNDVDPHNYLYAAAYGWGGLPMTTAQYVPVQVKSDQCQTWTVPKPDLNWSKKGFMSATFYGADGWIKEDDFYISHNDMKDEGDHYSFTTNCKKGPGNATVEKGGNFLIRMYLPNDVNAVKETADVIGRIEGVPSE